MGPYPSISNKAELKAFKLLLKRKSKSISLLKKVSVRQNCSEKEVVSFNGSVK